MSGTKEHSKIIIMKAGPYCGYTLDEIITIKQKEQDLIGKFFWGYSGVFCRPNIVSNLINFGCEGNYDAGKSRISVLFVETKSGYTSNDADRFTKYSTEGEIWDILPKEVLLVGNKSKRHFAITGDKLRKVDFQIDLSQYCTLMGMFPNNDQRLSSYFRYRVDKACAILSPDNAVEKSLVKISYVCELVEPYSVFIK